MKLDFNTILPIAQEKLLHLFVEKNNHFTLPHGKFYLGARHCGTFMRLH